MFVLSKDTSTELEKLREHVLNLISQWPRNQPLLLDYDPEYDEISEFWPQEYKINGRITLDYFKHINLFYSLRNSYVHENRPLGHAFELFDEPSPHYISRGVLRYDEDGKIIDLPHEAFELIHPTSFYYELINNALPRMKEYCRMNSIDPYSNFRFSSEWINL